MNDVSDLLTLVIPVRNEELTIATLIRVVRITPGLECAPIVVVDDGSNDRTPNAVNAMARTDDLLHYKRIQRANKDVALWNAAALCATPWIVCMDGDGQYDPRDILTMQLRERSNACGAVWGVRQNRCDTRWRHAQSVGGRIFKRGVLGRLAARDPGCGLFAVRHKLLAKIADSIPNPRGQVHCHIPEIIEALGHNVCEHPVTHRPRAAGRAKYGACNRIISGWRSLIQAHSVIAVNAGNRDAVNL